jgi:hypothetical protein
MDHMTRSNLYVVLNGCSTIWMTKLTSQQTLRKPSLCVYYYINHTYSVKPNDWISSCLMKNFVVR